MLADGSIIFAHVYRGTVIWDGEPRIIEIESAEMMPLLGMAMLKGHRLAADVVEGGPVNIVHLPPAM